MSTNGGEQSGTHQQPAEDQDGNAAEKEVVSGTGGEEEGQGSRAAGGESGQGEGSGKAGSSQGKSQEVDPDIVARREKQRVAKAEQRAKKKAEAVVPSEVLPQTPSSKKKDEAKKASKASTLTADLIAKQFYGMHELAALFLGEEVRIDQASSVMVGEAAYEIIQEYNLEFLGKWGKWAGLVSALAIVEVPVIMRLRAKQAALATQPLVKPVDSFQQPDNFAGVASGVPG